ncbi:uncharacterized protein [Nicotiana tomentosiformis]|uniref:uncharacterized protein n=1 Tax=Nicotiana tomentosiformis TaxID=4098 RepID=UPI00388C8B8E
MRGQGCSRGRGVARTTSRAAPVDPPVATAQEKVPDVVDPLGPAQAVFVQVAPTTFQARGGTQTLIACTPEQVVQGLQTPGVLASQPVAVAQAEVGPVMSDEEQKRLEIFRRFRPPSFSRAESEDAQDFLDRFQWILRTTGILKTSGVCFTTFQLSGDAFRWWDAYERGRPVGAAPLSWHEFSILFLEKFVPQTHREELCRQSEQLRQEGMFMTPYEMRFSELARHVIWLVPTERERIRRFIDGLTYQLCFVMTQESVSGSRFDEVVYISRRLELVLS